MIVRTRIFDFDNTSYKNLPELAQAMGIPASQIYGVQECKHRINQEFIVGVIKAFPNHKLGELFYLAPDTLDINDNVNHGHRYSATHSVDKPVTTETQE